MLSERTLHDGQNHLFCSDKISRFRNWLIKVWMSADIDRVSISRFFSDTDEQKQLLQKTVIFCVLEIKCLAAYDTIFSLSKTTWSISATSCWVLKWQNTPLMLDSLHLNAHGILDGSTDLVESTFTAILRMIARNIGDKVFDSKETRFQRVGITLKI